MKYFLFKCFDYSVFDKVFFHLYCCFFIKLLMLHFDVFKSRRSFSLYLTHVVYINDHRMSRPQRCNKKRN